MIDPNECKALDCDEPELCLRFGRHLSGPLLTAAKRIAGASGRSRDSARQSPLCKHRGGLTTPPPAALPGRQWVECRHPRRPLKTVEDPSGEKVCGCLGCGPDCAGYETAKLSPVSARQLWRFDETTLHRGWPGKRFNPALIEYGDGFLLAWRHGWAGCEIYLSRLDWRLAPVGDPIRLNLNHPAATYGREDARFFYYRGRLHLSFTGVIGGNGPTNVLYARLSDTFEVEAVHFPRVHGRASWEKNHAYFEHEGDLYAVYSYQPHRILRIDGDRAEWAYSTPSPSTWTVPGEIRGGASPIRIGDEWWHWFHSRRETGGGRQYCLGLYAFAAKPPFAVTRLVPVPLLWADFASKPADQYCAAVFPCGAVLHEQKRWLVSLGIHDRWGEIWEFDHREVSTALKRASGKG